MKKLLLLVVLLLCAVAVHSQVYYKYGCEDGTFANANITPTTGLSCSSYIVINGTKSIEIANGANGVLAPPGLPAEYNLSFFMRGSSLTTITGYNGLCFQWSAATNACYATGTGHGIGAGQQRNTTFEYLYDFSSAGGSLTTGTYMRMERKAGSTKIYRAGSLIGSQSQSVNQTNFFSTMTNSYTIYVDDVCIWTASGSGESECYGVPVTGVPSWVGPTPNNNAVNATQVTLNASCAGNIYLYFDGNLSPSTLVLTNSSSGNYTTAVSNSGAYYYKAQCWNETSGFSDNTSVRTWTYDALNPGITINPSNEFNAQNFSLRNPYDNEVFLNFTFADNNALFGYVVNITRGGVVYYNETNITLSGLQANYTRTLSAASWPAGVYNISVIVEDAHTARSIPDYQVTARKSSLTFKTENENNVKVETREAANITATKEFDRYSFRVRFDDGAARSRVFDVKTDKCPLVYLPGSKYRAHFVSSCGVGGNWVDFEGVPGVPVVKRIDDYHYSVNFSSVPADVTFRSIGGLNVLWANYTFYRGVSANFTPSAFSLEPTTAFLNLSTAPSIANISATLYYNGSVIVPVVASSSSLYEFSANITPPNVTVQTFVPVVWVVNVTQGDGNRTTFNVSGTHGVSLWSLSPCVGGEFIRFTQFDEDSTATALSGTLAVEVVYWVGSPANAQMFNASLGFNDAWGLCFSPSYGSFSANIYAQNAVPGGFTHRFYVRNGTYTNTTTNYVLYSPNNASTAAYSDLKLTTRYVTDYKYFKNVYAVLQRRYIDSGAWRSVQWDKSGDYGLIYFDVKEQSVDYRILFYDENNTVLKQTDALKFVCTAGVCELTQLLDPAAGASSSADVTTNYSFNNATGMLSVSWTGSSSASSTVRLSVVKQTTRAETDICTQTQTGNAGVFACNTTGFSGTLYLKVDANGEPAASGFVEVARPRLANFMSRGLQVLVTLLIMLTIVGFGLFSPFALVLSTLAGLIVVFWLGIFSPLTVTFLIIAAVLGLVVGMLVRQ